ncbi:PhzF family phenazine biosynthesis protein [Kribbella sp. VKM Ac-2566]|uniref:PhzF family phenazine biosynthesis protein n=1 Tax=Kribbella sp. VKM Ac-2566 TaxID=2512218 RepID=UPI001062B52A|nr:PhzF family phenazine biosynthesis protein [Kribbella sp. VKM Ac-2566]TDX08311.1 PhzF family phenazine biosynthesis protein [Kribbella sp. VKM Ac-2566]
MSADPTASGLSYHHVDVFSRTAYAGNSLAVFVDPPALAATQLSRITQELRHFESIFITRTAQAEYNARVFDLEGELDFAGHPVLGAAAVLHACSDDAAQAETWWTFRLPARTVRVRTSRSRDGHLSALLDQGRPEIVRILMAERPTVAEALGLMTDDLDPTLPLEIVSTGLRYLIVPVNSSDALEQARIQHPNFGEFLREFGAQFVYVLDAHALEGRHWNNDGVIEDVATGSAAGCVGAYLRRHGLARDGAEIRLKQGRFVGRPSEIAVTAHGTADDVERVTVGGDVAIVGGGWLLKAPLSEMP